MISMVFENAGYVFRPFEGSSGRPRFRKDRPNGVVFFFPFKDEGTQKYHLCVRKVGMSGFLDDVINEIIEEDKLPYWIDRMELFETL